MLQHMVQNIERTTQLVQEISAAKKEQDVCADLANKAIQQLDQLIQQNAQLSDQMATSAERSLITAGAIACINLVF